MTCIVHGSRDVETQEVARSSQLRAADVTVKPGVKTLGTNVYRLLVQELHIKPYRGLGSSSPCLACYKEKDVATEYVSWVQARTIGELCSLSDRWVQSRSRATLGISRKIM